MLIRSETAEGIEHKNHKNIINPKKGGGGEGRGHFHQFFGFFDIYLLQRN